MESKNRIMWRIKIFLLNLWRNTALRIWLAGTLVYSMFSVCPCCGQRTCPGNFGAAALLGGIGAFISVGLNKVKQLLTGVFQKEK
jgi:hypothetical protein